MNNINVNKVERDQIAAALIMLEDVDVDLLDMREMLLRGEYRCKALANEFRELAMKVERTARDYDIGG